MLYGQGSCVGMLTRKAGQDEMASGDTSVWSTSYLQVVFNCAPLLGGFEGGAEPPPSLSFFLRWGELLRLRLYPGGLFSSFLLLLTTTTTFLF